MSKPAVSQFWETAGLPYYAYQIKSTYTDSASQKLYFVGSIDINGIAPPLYNTIAYYNNINQSWSYLDTLNDIIQSIVVFNNDIYIGGNFTTINGQYIPYIAKYNGTNWVNIGQNIDFPVIKLKVINQELYALGYFSQIGGILANKVAKYDGTNWQNVNNFPIVNGVPSDIALYNGNLYISGLFYTTSLGNHIIAYKNNNWQSVGGGILGANDDIHSIEVYNNELYVAGNIFQSDGNIGQGIQKWNGQNWNSVGGGFYSQTSNGLGRYLKVHNGKLYASGAFDNAGGIPAYSIAYWDSTQWCSISNQNLFSITTFDFLNDTLYVATPIDSINNIFINKSLKYIGGSYTDTCGNLTTIPEQSNHQQLTIHPNPSTGIYTITTNQPIQNIKIYNIISECVLAIASPLGRSGGLSIDLTNQPNGIYFVQIETDQTTFNKKIIKQ